jgi:2-oxoglutarate/2-oxoacid ferredoxin oxidoreductase subunit alpha
MISMPKTALNWKIAGPAGEGIKSSGAIFAKTCLRHGLSTFDYTEYPSLIRGGHNTYQVYTGVEKVHAQSFNVDIMVALNQNGVALHLSELTSESVLIYDSVDSKTDITQYQMPAIVYDVPLVQIAKDIGADRLMYNNVALGVSVFLAGLDLEILHQVITDMFKGKGEAVVTLNINASDAGYTWAKTNIQKPMAGIALTKQPQKDTLSISGNEALALGAIAGGLKAYFAYPMTPSSSILHALADWSTKADVFVKHAEDEIGVINMALGASFAGVRSAVGTSGGGFCYMTEAVGFSGVAELPLVIFESMRPGPALGMPTWTAQGDLLFTIWASQDEFPRIVLAPGDVFEAFDLTRQAFDWADQFQIPIIILSDKYLSESNQSTHYPNTAFDPKPLSREASPTVDTSGFFPRYRVTESGVSPRSVPGQPGGLHIATTYEHDDYGLTTEESAMRITQADKRMKKFDSINKMIPLQYYDGSDNPDITFISFGSTVNPIRQALPALRAEGIDAAVLNLSWLWPFPVDQVREAISKSKNPMIVEGNSLHQLAKLIAQETGINVYHKRTKYDGRPFYPHEIINYAHEIL